MASGYWRVARKEIKKQGIEVGHVGRMPALPSEARRIDPREILSAKGTERGRGLRFADSAQNDEVFSFEARRRGSGPSRHQSQPRMAVPQAIYFFGQGKPFEGQDRLAEASVQTGHQSQPRMAVPESQSLPSLGQAQDRRVASEEREAKRRVVHHRAHRDHRAEKRMADPFLGQDKCVQGSLQTGQYTSKTEKISTVGRRGSRNSGGWDLK